MTIMSRNLKITLGILAVAVAIGLISLSGLRGRIQRLAQSQKSEEQARREVLALPISTPTDVMVTARIFWAAGADKTAPTELPLPLSADPVQRSKQVLQALLTNPPTPDQRTIPAEAELLGLYILPDGTAIADFSDALASKTPSGILSERLAVDSIARTLENNVPGLHRLKILIHGQEVETLAGHVDLTGFFDLNPPPQQSLPPAAGSAPLSPGSAAAPLPPVPAMPPERPSN
jgi:hypothetical protein